jgi:WD40 repeat protein/tRNA A-37 threonylcarbamoyl transferase component Bud32
MPEPNASNASGGDPLDAVIADYLQQVDAGAVPDRQALLARHPGLADRLGAFFADCDRLDRQAADLRLSADPHRTTDDTPPAEGLPRVRYFGDYELLEVIARGGMGVVYKARQVSLNRLVALKMILKGELASERDLARFRAEAEAAANLDHPHIVPIYEVGEHQGQHYYAMRYVEGTSLARHPRSDARTEARLVAAVARAVYHAHQRGLLHRDLKPSNILVDAAGTPFVTDFGLAKRVDADRSLTESGAVLGTPRYMAPEQAEGRKDLTVAADVYALGVVLYERLTGATPFRGEAVLEVLRQVREAEPPRPSSLRRGLDRDLETICLKCLEKDAAKRYGSTEALAEDLERWQRREPIQARAVGQTERLWRWCRRNPLVAGLVAAVVTVLIAGSGTATVMALYLADARAAAEKNAAHERQARAVAEEKEGQERLARGEADRQRDEVRRQVVRLMGTHGVRLVDEGDFFGGAVWFTEALQRDQGGPDERLHRLRLALTWQQCPRLLHIFRHDGWVFQATFSPDGRRILTASKDQTARVWDAATGEPVGQPLRHKHQVYHAAFSPDGRRVVTASFDHTARVWDATTGQPVSPPLPHDGLVFHAAFSPDGSRVATASYDKTARVWDAATGRPLTPPLTHGREVNHVEFSPDGGRVLTASEDATARVWDAATGQPAGPPLRHEKAVFQAAFSPDGRRLVTASHDHTARVWDAATGRAVTPPLRHDREVRHAAFSPDGGRVATASYDKTARVWDAATGQPLTLPLTHSHCLWQAAFSPDGRCVVTASEDPAAWVWDTATGQPLTASLPQGGRVRQVAFSPDGSRVVTASQDGTARVWEVTVGQSFDPLPPGAWLRQMAFSADTRALVAVRDDNQVRVWDVATGRPLSRALPHSARVMHGALSPDGRRVVTACADGTARVWETAPGRPLFPALGHEGAVLYAAFSPDGRRVVTASKDHTARIWNAATGGPEGRPLRHQDQVHYAAFSPDGCRVVTACAGQGQVWEVATGRPVTPPLGHGALVYQAVFSPAGDRVVTASEDDTARVWEAATGQPLGEALRHGDRVAYATFSPDGRRVVTASNDFTARVWDAATGRPLGPPLPHGNTVYHAAFSPDGRLVATASFDKTARVWDWATGQPLCPSLKHRSVVRLVTFSPDGRRVFTAGHAPNARVWDLTPDARAPDDLLLLARLLAARQRDASGALGVLDARAERRAWRALRQKYPADFAPPSAEHYRAWHRQEAEACARARLRDGVVLHLLPVLEAEPLDEELWDRWADNAFRCLAAGGADGYRRACTLLLERFEQTQDPRVASQVARNCKFGPNAVADLERPVRLAERAVASAPKRARYLNHLGALLYRAGRYEEAVRRLDEARAARGGEGIVFDWVWLAMAHQRLGHGAEARRWFGKVVHELDQAPTRGEPLLELQILCREAEALLREKAAGSAP